ncbi:MAG: DUF4011 domain-containing protein [Lentisphaeria bacterium]|nr:DUF4011 domain-containing protein [Lentisphaeria bacterium]
MAEDNNKTETEVQVGKDRLERWRQKLLDLSLRNRLLNVRDNQFVIPLVCEDISKLEDILAGNGSMKVQSLETVVGEEAFSKLPQNPDATANEILEPLKDKKLDTKQLYALPSEKELQKRLLKIYRQTHADMEDGGVNTLYLTIGYLKWSDPSSRGRFYIAPLILMPLRMVRKTFREGMFIAKSDEETIVNVTLLELLKQMFRMTIAGVDPLPMDDSGVDVAAVLNSFRTAIDGMDGWEVLDIAKVGHFSFGKFIMWNDMTARADELRQNKIVEHLVQGGGLFDDSVEVFPINEIYNHLDLMNLYCPMNADSSQMAAVLYSALGKSFVLHGPPGTGKSQTITNIIAHNVAIGRRVLFVSEKKAALDVVHRRLTKVGLKPFCLELHSNKAGKKEVLAQFAEALQEQENAQKSSENWTKLVMELTKVRNNLNEYVRELHKPYPNGLSAYQCFMQQIDRGSAWDNLLKINALTQTKEEYDAMRKAVTELVIAFNDTTDESRNALDFLSVKEWNPLVQNELEISCKKLLDSVKALWEAFDAVAEPLVVPENCFETAKDVQSVMELTKQLSSSPDIPAAFLTSEFGKQMNFIVDFANNTIKLNDVSSKLGAFNLDKVAQLDLEGLRHRIHGNNKKFFITKYFANRKLLKELADIKKIGSPELTMTELTKVLPLLEEYLKYKKLVEEQTPAGAAMLGGLWKEAQTDWTTVSKMLDATHGVLTTLDKLCHGDEAARLAMLNALKNYLPTATVSFRADTAVHQSFKTLDNAWSMFREMAKQCAANFEEPADLNYPKSLADKLEAALGVMSELRHVVLWKQQRATVEGYGLAGLVTALTEHTLNSSEAAEAVDTAYYHDMLYQVMAESPALSHFSCKSYEEVIREFCILDNQYMELTKKAVFAKLVEKMTKELEKAGPKSSELGLLKRECEKKMRHKPVRVLLEGLPTLAPVLKPCFLMSPLSVAQYLPPDSSFDLVVFDEASQIPVWDAIGVIARGKQLIVVGDPKQMPPTNFFQKGETGAEDDDDEGVGEDLESILDECLAAGLHSTFLNWHYRSRHESLIAFSNKHYYENRLFTFPSASNGANLGVSFKFVEGGTYDRRASRTNRAEAEALIKLIQERLENQQLNKKSIGVVTFSQAQKDLIDDLMDEFRREHPELEQFFSESLEEPLFVKNLENVQGDERDVIIFSIGYAPDKDGKFAMNFGPLNRAGGERRLNVAITRAKEQVIVVSSVHAEQIDMSRTSSIGAAHLRAFLKYAESGAALEMKGGNDSKRTVGVVQAAYDHLVKQGYRVQRDIGSSAYKIDLAVVDPNDETHYVLGIECDGPSYARQVTTRDREQTRQSVLKGLGWNMFRLWSVEWAFDRDKAEKELDAAVQAALPKAK